MEVFFKDPSKKKASRPVACACYICGREYGTHSLQIHIKTCKKKWEIEQSKLPKRKRRPCPEAPVEFDGALSALKSNKLTAAQKTEIMAQQNEIAYAKWDKEALVTCKHCGRTFLPDRLVIHQRSCTEDRPLKARTGTTVANCLIGGNKQQYEPVLTQNARQGAGNNLGRSQARGRGGGALLTETQRMMREQKSSFQAAGTSASHQLDPFQNGRQQRSGNFSTVLSSDSVGPEEYCALAYQDSEVEVEVGEPQNTYAAQRLPARRRSPNRRTNNFGEQPQDSSVAGSDGGANYNTRNQNGEDVGANECRYCRSIVAGKIFEHETLCPSRPKRTTKQVKPARQVMNKPASKGTNWREQHNTIQQSIKVARQMKIAQETGNPEAHRLAIELSEAMPKQEDTRVQCPYCERRYAQNVADRHIPRCKDIVNRPKPPPSKTAAAPRSKAETIAAQFQPTKHLTKHRVGGIPGQNRPSSTLNKQPSLNSQSSNGARVKTSTYGSPKGSFQNSGAGGGGRPTMSQTQKTAFNPRPRQQPGAVTYDSDDYDEDEPFGRQTFAANEDGQVDAYTRHMVNQVSRTPTVKGASAPQQQVKGILKRRTPQGIERNSDIGSGLDDIQILLSERAKKNRVEERHFSSVQPADEFFNDNEQEFDNNDDYVGEGHQDSVRSEMNLSELRHQDQQKSVIFENRQPMANRAGAGVSQGRGNQANGRSSSRRQSSLIDQEGLYQPQPSLLDRSALYSNVQCPHCLRNFSKSAAERHIPVCQHIQAKPKSLARKTGERSVGRQAVDSGSRGYMSPRTPLRATVGNKATFTEQRKPSTAVAGGGHQYQQTHQLNRLTNYFIEHQSETPFTQTMMTDTSIMQEKSAAQRQREHVERMMVKNNRKKVAPGSVRQRNEGQTSPDPTRRISAQTMSDYKGGKKGMLQKGTYESPLKKFVRENEGNVLSSGDSGSNLGSIGDREIIKPLIGGHGHGAGKTQFDDSSEKLNDGYQSNDMHQFIDDVETEQKFSQMPMSQPAPLPSATISSTTISFDPQTFSRYNNNTTVAAHQGELTASSQFIQPVDVMERELVGHSEACYTHDGTLLTIDGRSHTLQDEAPQESSILVNPLSSQRAAKHNSITTKVSAVRPKGVAPAKVAASVSKSQLPNFCTQCGWKFREKDRFCGGCANPRQ